MDPRSRKDWWQSVPAGASAVEGGSDIRHDVIGLR